MCVDSCADAGRDSQRMHRPIDRLSTNRPFTADVNELSASPFASDARGETDVCQPVEMNCKRVGSLLL